MMNTLSSFLGGGILAGTAYLMTGPLFPEPEFLNVIEITQVGDQVGVSRIVNGQKTVADWRVTVVGVGVDAPYCQTTPGPEMHQGWSPYAPGRGRIEMSLDVWVGDTGCFERLVPGDYIEITTWTPRDGRKPVTHRRTFTKE